MSMMVWRLDPLFRIRQGVFIGGASTPSTVAAASALYPARYFTAQLAQHCLHDEKMSGGHRQSSR